MTQTDAPDSIDPRTASGARRKARTRKRLIEAAVLELAVRGPENTVIDHVISRAGVSRGTFYNYFPSMEEVLDAAKTELGEEMVALVTSVPEDFPDPALRMAVRLRMFLELALRYPLFLEFHARLGLRALGPGNLLHDEAPEDLARAQASGRFAAMPPLLAVEILQAGAFVTLRRMEQGDDVDLSEFVAAMLRMLGIGEAEARDLAAQPIPPLELPEDSLILRSERVRAGRGR